MIEELKKIKINEVEKEISYMMQNKPKRKKYNWFEKYIFKKKEFENSFKKYYKEIDEYESKINILKEKKYKYENAESPIQLDLSFEKAIELLNEYNKPITLTQTDLTKTGVITKPDVDKIDGLILVHKTGYVPTDSRIHSVKEAKVTVNTTYTIAEKEIEFNVEKERNTVHFSVNGEVNSHTYGNWEDKKYAILIPFKDVPQKNIGCAACQDTFVVGGVDLTENCWILAPEKEIEIIKNNNPKVNVIGYKGNSVSGYADQLIMNLGYHHQLVTNNGWEKDIESQHKYNQLMQLEGLSTDQHSNTLYSVQEKFDTNMNVILNLLSYAYDNSEMLKNEDFKNELIENIKKKINSTIIVDNYIPGYNQEYLTMMINEKLKNTPLILNENEISELQKISITEIKNRLPYILINKLSYIIQNKTNEIRQEKTK